jgi:protein involved in polysaccharide export with SLBB domain
MKWIFTVVAFLVLIVGSQSNQSAQVLSPEKFVTAKGKPPVIVPGSLISITVDEDRTLNRAYTVSDSGVIDYPPLGRVAVEGLTTKEAADRIRKALEKEYFQKATVVVTIVSAPDSGGVIYVIGNVNRPGPVVLPKEERLTITKAIGAAGDFSTTANGEKVQLIRYDAAGKKHVTYINVDRITKRGEIEKDVAVQNGDWIVVP